MLQKYIFQNGMFNKFYYIHSSLIGYMIYIVYICIYMKFSLYINFFGTADSEARSYTKVLWVRL
jgi:hypothetical protein